MKNKKIFGITANLFWLSLVSLLNDASSEMIMPILPMFITSLGGTGIIIGLVGGLRDSIASLLKVVSGYWSDKLHKRKVFVFNGYLASSVFKLFLAFVKSWQSLLVFSSLERVGKGMRDAPRDAMIAKGMAETRGKVFGIHRTFDTTGAILGSITVFLLFWIWGLGFKTIILSATVVSFLSLFPFIFVKEKRKDKQETIKIEFEYFKKPLIIFLLISGTFALANFSYMFFIMRAQECFPGKTGMLSLYFYIFCIIFFMQSLPYLLVFFMTK
jgi:hypothetical protein